jgi:hypothetical protein
MFSNLLPQKKNSPHQSAPRNTQPSNQPKSPPIPQNIIFTCICVYLFNSILFVRTTRIVLAVLYRSIEPNTTSKFPKMATISCSINPRINISKLRIWRKSEHLIRSRVQLQKYNIMYSKYSPLGCSTTLKVNPGILIHQIL